MKRSRMTNRFRYGRISSRRIPLSQPPASENGKRLADGLQNRPDGLAVALDGRPAPDVAERADDLQAAAALAARLGALGAGASSLGSVTASITSPIRRSRQSRSAGAFAPSGTTCGVVRSPCLTALPTSSAMISSASSERYAEPPAGEQLPDELPRGPCLLRHRTAAGGWSPRASPTRPRAPAETGEGTPEEPEWGRPALRRHHPAPTQQPSGEPMQPLSASSWGLVPCLSQYCGVCLASMVPDMPCRCKTGCTFIRRVRG